jgi:hypothetical protein
MPWKRKSKSRRKSKKRLALLPFILTPPAVYAVHVLLLFLLDSAWGDGLMLHQYLNESRGVLARQLVSDGWRALPVFYAASLLLWFEVRLLSRFLHLRGVVSAAVAGAVTGWLLAFLLIGKSNAVVIPYMISGLLMAAVLGWITHPPTARKRR